MQPPRLGILSNVSVNLLNNRFLIPIYIESELCIYSYPR